MITNRLGYVRHRDRRSWGILGHVFQEGVRRVEHKVYLCTPLDNAPSIPDNHDVPNRREVEQAWTGLREHWRDELQRIMENQSPTSWILPVDKGCTGYDLGMGNGNKERLET